MMKKAVIVDSEYGSVALCDQQRIGDKLKADGIDLILCHCADEKEIIEKAAGAEMVLCTGNPPITERVLGALPELKAVLRFGIGVNSVDLRAATRYGKIVLFMPGFCVNELAVHATAMILALDRNLHYYDSRIRQGLWPKAGYYMPRAPRHMILGLVGFGGSAKELYKIFRFGFGSQVKAYDPFISEEARRGYEVDFVDFETLLAECDIVSLHLPLNADTKHIMNAETFSRMKKDSILINVSRGGLVDQAALSEALESGRIRFAGLDVFEQEPLGKDSPLLTKDNVILTCHSAFYGDESKEMQITWAYEMTREMLKDGMIRRNRVANTDILPLAEKQYQIV